MAMFSKEIKAITLLELRTLEHELESAVDAAAYTEKRIAELTRDLPKEKANIERIRAEFADKLKRFKEQP